MSVFESNHYGLALVHSLDTLKAILSFTYRRKLQRYLGQEKFSLKGEVRSDATALPLQSFLYLVLHRSRRSQICGTDEVLFSFLDSLPKLIKLVRIFSLHALKHFDSFKVSFLS